jgi:hypothetical protein
MKDENTVTKIGAFMVVDANLGFERPDFSSHSETIHLDLVLSVSGLQRFARAPGAPRRRNRRGGRD